MFAVPRIKGPRVASIQKGRADYGSEDFDFGSYGEAVIAEDSVRELSVRCMTRFDPVLS